MRDYGAEATAYARAVLSGEIDAGKFVKAACRRHIDDLARFKGRAAKYRFNPELQGGSGQKYRPADRVCAFVELMPHVKGELAGERMRLEPWQTFFLASVFGWVDAKGRRRFRRAYCEVPRGNGKSQISSAVALYMLTADGEQGAEVYSLATTRDQAAIVFSAAHRMASITPEFRERFGVETFAHNLHVMRTGSKFEALSAEGSTLDGLNIHFGCVDELHAHKTRMVFDVVETATGKRKNSLLWLITTAGSDRSSVCYEQRTFLTKVLDGVFDDDSLFGVIYGIDKGDDWTTEAALKKANPNWGVSVQPDVLLALQAKAIRTPSAVNNFKTKHLNEWVNANVSWMNMLAWDACGDPSLCIDDYVGRKCWIGLDLASKIDIAALVILFEREGGGYAVFGRYWLPHDTVMSAVNSQYQGWAQSEEIIATPGNVIDFAQIESELMDMAAKYGVQAVAYDPFQATQLSTRMMAEGLPMIEVRPTVLNFSEPMKMLESLVMQKKIAHDGGPVLTWMASNVVAHMDVKDNIYPRKERPENKIDGIVALLMALSRALASDVVTKKQPMVVAL